MAHRTWMCALIHAEPKSRPYASPRFQLSVVGGWDQAAHLSVKLKLYSGRCRYQGKSIVMRQPTHMHLPTSGHATVFETGCGAHICWWTSHEPPSFRSPGHMCIAAKSMAGEAWLGLKSWPAGHTAEHALGSSAVFFNCGARGFKETTQGGHI